MATDSPMQLGIVGLGRMGSAIARRLLRDGHRVVGYDRAPDVVTALQGDGGTGAASVEELVAALEPPRAIWLMLPAGPITESALVELAALLDAEDTVVDGGNTHFPDDIRRAEELRARGIHYLETEKCVMCWKCSDICPVDCIYIEGTRGADGVLKGGYRGQKATLAKFTVDYTVCIFCGLCEEPCPPKCIWLGPGYDYDHRNHFHFDLAPRKRSAFCE